MKKLKYSERLEQLYTEIYEQEEHYSYAYIIKHLLEKNILEKLITNINDTKTITNTRCLSKTKKGYLTGNEQFLMLLDDFIYMFSRVGNDDR